MQKSSDFLKVAVALLILAASASCLACDTCILYGKDHAFALTAPKGWVLDTSSGVPRGLFQVFYPKGETFRESPVFAYSRVRAKDREVKTIEDQVADTIAKFRPDSPSIKAEHKGTIKIDGAKLAQVYYYTGDQWGNFEAVAYIDEPKTINFVVLSARNLGAFQRSLPALDELMKSYLFVSDNVVIEDAESKTVSLPATLDDAASLGSKQENDAATKGYHSGTLMPYFGNRYAAILKSCFAKLTKPDERPFHFVAAIGARGEVLRVYQDLQTNVFSCMTHDLAQEHFPPPPVTPYFLNIEMRFTN